MVLICYEKSYNIYIFLNFLVKKIILVFTNKHVFQFSIKKEKLEKKIENGKWKRRTVFYYQTHIDNLFQSLWFHIEIPLTEVRE